MYSKQLTASQNDALKGRYEIMKNDKTIQVKLDFPAATKSKKRGTRGNRITVEQFWIQLVVFVTYQYQEWYIPHNKMCTWLKTFNICIQNRI